MASFMVLMLLLLLTTASVTYLMIATLGYQMFMSNIRIQYASSHAVQGVSFPPAMIQVNSLLAIAARNTEQELYCTFGRYGYSNPNISHWVRFNSSTPVLPFKLKARAEELLLCPWHCDNQYGWSAPKQCPIRGLVGPCQNPASIEHGCSINLPMLCAAMNGRQLLLLGDSTMERIYVSLRRQINHQRRVKWLRTVECSAISKFPNFDLRFERNDLLLLSDDAIANALINIAAKKKFRSDRYNQFQPLLRNGSVIIMNRGVHVESTKDVLRDLHELLSVLQTNYSQASLFYSTTTVPVHRSFWTHAHMPSSTYLPEIRSHAENDMYEWLKIGPQNLQVDAFLSKHFPQVVRVDTAHMIKFRPDCRMDSVHSCIPGFANWQAVQFVHAVIKHSLELPL